MTVQSRHLDKPHTAPDDKMRAEGFVRSLRVPFAAPVRALLVKRVAELLEEVRVEIQNRV